MDTGVGASDWDVEESSVHPEEDGVRLVLLVDMGEAGGEKMLGATVSIRNAGDFALDGDCGIVFCLGVRDPDPDPLEGVAGILGGRGVV